MPAADMYSKAGNPNLPSSGSSMISWSKNGFICYAIPGSQGHNLNMTYLENTNGCKWQLAAPHEYTIKPLGSSNVPDLQVISWNGPSTDLAIFDQYGNFYVLMAGVRVHPKKNELPGSTRNGILKVNSNSDSRSNNKIATAMSRNIHENESFSYEGPSYELASSNCMEMIYKDTNSYENFTSTRGRCVAFEWLGIDKPQVFNKPAKLSKNGSSYTYGVHQYQPVLLAHPLTSKHACVALKENGELSLYHQGEHKLSYYKSAAKLEPNGVNGEVYFTHASIGFSTNKKIIVTAYETITEKIYTYSVTVDWGYLVEAASKQKSDPLYCTPTGKKTSPSIYVSLVHEMLSFSCIGANTNMQISNTAFSETGLSRIDLISPCYQLNSTLDILVTNETRGADGSTFCTINRYHLKKASSCLSDPFSSMNETKTLTDNFHTLVFQDKIVIPNRIKFVGTASSNSVVLFIDECGTITSVNRSDWSITFPQTVIKKDQEIHESFVNNKPESINSFLDCGFEAPRIIRGNAPLAFATSPNLTCMVYIHIGVNKPAVLSLFKPTSKFWDIALLSSAFSHSHANACYSMMSSDDLIAFFQAQYESIEDTWKRKELIEKAIVESHSAINIQLLSFNKESVDKLLSNPQLQKLMSLQLTLSELGGEKLPEQIASTSLGLRSTSLAMMFTLSTMYRQMSKKKPADDTMEDSVNRAECIISLVGPVRWFIDLLIYLNQELLQLSFAKNNPSQSTISFENSLVLPLLLSRVPRLFLMYAIGSIGKTHENMKKLHNDLSESNKLFTPMKEALERFFNTSNYSPLKLTVFESFLRECDETISKELSTKWSDQSSLPRLEQKLFCEGVVSSQLFPLASLIVDKFSAIVSRDSRLSSLYFYDSCWLQIGAAHTSTLEYSNVKHISPFPTTVRHQYSQSEAIDALRKIYVSCKSPLKSGGVSHTDPHFETVRKLKKCVRCRCVSLASDPLAFDLPKTIGLWTMVFQRNCICGSAWVSCEINNELSLLF